MVVVILSSTVLTPGRFDCEEVAASEVSFVGIPHYVRHPSTKEILEGFGSVPAPAKFFSGLQIGESYLSVRLNEKKLQEARATGVTQDMEVKK